jgi:FkbM family methyltransferase
MTFTSYAQNLEDVILMRALGHVQAGTYIDIGANDPVADSVSLAFYERGWRGVHVEPVPEFADRLREARPDEEVIQAIVGLRDGMVPFYSIRDTGMSTADQVIAKERERAGFPIEEIHVKSITLATIFDKFDGRDIHWLKIDVEGMEEDVIESWGTSKARPWIIVLESVSPTDTTVETLGWEKHLIKRGYQFAYFDGLNRFYVIDTHRELLKKFDLGPNFLDDFVVGDLSPFARGVQAQLASRAAEIQNLNLAVVGRDRQLADAVAKQGELQRSVQDFQSRLKGAEARGTALQSQLDAAEARIAALYKSTSWRLTAPLRRLAIVARTLLRGGVAWASFAPGSRPRRLSRRWLMRCFDAIVGNPWLRPVVGRVFRRFPRLKERLMTAIRNERALSLDFGLRGATNVASATLMSPFVAPADEATIYLFVDHTVACATNTGVQRTVRGIASGLTRLGQRVRYVKWDPNLSACVLIDQGELQEFAKWNGPSITDEEREGYPSSGEAPVPVVPRFGDWLIVPEVPHITFQRMPATLELIIWARGAGIGVGFVFYDAIPLRRGEFAHMAPAHAAYMQALRLADIVWPISRWATDDLVAFWAAGENATPDTMPKVLPLHLAGALDWARATAPAAVTEKLILAVGTLEPRKNQLALIRAFRTYLRDHPGSDWRLVLVGNLHPLVTQEVQEACAAVAEISHRPAIPDKELRDLFERAAFTVFPSLEEGFGLPILESLWFGKPCLCADFGSMGEVAEGGGCLTIDMNDEAALLQALQRLIEDDDLRQRLASEACARAMIEWKDYARSIRDSAWCATGPIFYYWVDGTVAFAKNTGIQRVVRQLARELMQNGNRLVPVKFNSDGTGLASATLEDLLHLARWNGPSPEMWSEWIPPAAVGANGFFIMAELPVNLTARQQSDLKAATTRYKLKTAAVFYDNIPWKMKDVYRDFYSEPVSGAHRRYMNWIYDFDLVMPISNYSTKELFAFYKAEGRLQDPSGVEILPAVLPGEFPESPRTRRPSAVKADGPITILCVGTIEPRKNHLVLLEAFILATRRSRRELRLVIAGRRTEPRLAERIETILGENNNIVWEDNADDARLNDLHRACDFTAYPSLEEGFGLPILESLWYGKPSICADFGAMAEVAEGGGCLMVDVRNGNALAEAILELANNPERLLALSSEAVSRPFRSWREYAKDVQSQLQHLAPRLPAAKLPTADDILRRADDMHLVPRPKLSVCISTYNRAEWLAVSLRNWARLYPEPIQGVELFVCDNASTDHTPEVVKSYLDRSDFVYRRNPVNVGMLGNLRETAHAAHGSHIWILGDDDLLLPGSIERVLQSIDANPGVGLIYLNYSFTRLEDARQIADFESFFHDATPIVPPEPDLVGPIRDICARNENFFTAIYTLVLRRDHAIGAYSQNTSGRPFSTMLTCIPTTYYVLHHMMEEKGVWLGSPQVVVNMNVSWMRYAPLWILERIPEVYDVAERRGVSPDDINRWRRHTLPSVVAFFRQIFEQDSEGNAAFIDLARVVRRFSALPEFADAGAEMRAVYEKAHLARHPLATRRVDEVFPSMSAR